jgi:Spy/CpxP family protein refolding chaperone
MNSWKIIPAVMIIFGAGVLTGGLLVNYVDQGHRENGRFPFWRATPRAQMSDPTQASPGELNRPRTPEMWRKDFLGHLDEKLKLTPEQHADISRIIAEGQEQNREIWTNIAPRMHQEMELVQQRIREELTPEQQKQFEVLTKQFAPHRPSHGQDQPGSPPATNNPAPILNDMPVR